MLYPYGWIGPAFVGDARTTVAFRTLYQRWMACALAPLLLKYVVAGMFGSTAGWICAAVAAIVLAVAWPVAVRRTLPGLRRSPVQPSLREAFVAQAREQSIGALVRLLLLAVAMIAFGAASIVIGSVSVWTVITMLMGAACFALAAGSLAVRRSASVSGTGR